LIIRQLETFNQSSRFYTLHKIRYSVEIQVLSICLYWSNDQYRHAYESSDICCRPWHGWKHGITKVCILTQSWTCWNNYFYPGDRYNILSLTLHKHCYHTEMQQCSHTILGRTADLCDTVWKNKVRVNFP